MGVRTDGCTHVYAMQNQKFLFFAALTKLELLNQKVGLSDRETRSGSRVQVT